MLYSRDNIETNVGKLERILSETYPAICAVLATDQTPAMIAPDEDSAYAHVYLLNVGASEMLAVEDAAYDAWEDVRSDAHASVCFFFYTPEETTNKFPRWSAAETARPSCKTVRNLMAAGRWVTASQSPEPQRESWELVRMSQQMAALPCFSRDEVKHRAAYQSTDAADVELCTDLPKAA